MEGYELTDRGKIAIAVIVAVLLLLVPSVILVYKTVAAEPVQPPGIQGSEASGASGASPPFTIEPTPREIEDSPPPNGGGFNPPEVSAPNGAVTSTGDDELDEDDLSSSSRPDDSSHGRVDPSAGTLSFTFSPGSQDTLHTEVTSMLVTFLSSSRNTQNSIIIVEIPSLPDEVTITLVAAIVNAFAAQGVGEQRLEFTVLPSVISGGTVEVNLHYTTRQGK